MLFTDKPVIAMPQRSPASRLLEPWLSFRADTFLLTYFLGVCDDKGRDLVKDMYTLWLLLTLIDFSFNTDFLQTEHRCGVKKHIM